MVARSWYNACIPLKGMKGRVLLIIVNKMHNKIVDSVALILVIVGGLNWGLIGLADINLVSMIFGIGLIAKIVYILVGLSAVYMAAMAMKKMG